VNLALKLVTGAAGNTQLASKGNHTQVDEEEWNTAVWWHNTHK